MDAFGSASSESNCGRPRVVIDGFNSTRWETERDIDVLLLRAVLMETDGAIGDLPAELRELETRLCLCLCDEPFKLLLSAGGVIVETAKNKDRRNSEGV